MKRYYAEICVWIEAKNEKDAELIAQDAANRTDAVNGVTSSTVNDVEQCGDEDEEG